MVSSSWPQTCTTIDGVEMLLPSIVTCLAWCNSWVSPGIADGYHLLHINLDWRHFWRSLIYLATGRPLPKANRNPPRVCPLWVAPSPQGGWRGVIWETASPMGGHGGTRPRLCKGTKSGKIQWLRMKYGTLKASRSWNRILLGSF